MSITRAFALFLLPHLLTCNPNPAWAALEPMFQDIGRISVSVDGEGNNDAEFGGSLEVNKPVGATVRRAFLMANSHGVFGTRVINDGDVSLNGVPVAWDISVFNGITNFPQFFHNVFADVTSIVAPAVNNLSPGLIGLNVFEQGTESINGTVLVVIFNDPNQGADNSVILLFGGQEPGGETIRVQLGSPIQADTAKLDMGLGIGHSFQGANGTDMVNLVDVNGTRLTSSAGGEDDGIQFTGGDGGLITVGGIGDENSNPDPFSPSFNFRTDDELYDLRPFVSIGNQKIEVFSFNATDNDNIFFAYFVTSVLAGVGDAELSITKADFPDPVFIGQPFTYTLTVRNNGPNNATGVTVTDPLPGGVGLISSTPSQGSCSGTSTVSCALGILGNGASATVTIVVTPTSAGTLTNTASVSGILSDLNPGNNSVTIATTVQTVPPDAEPANPNVLIPCTASKCNVQIRCNLAQISAAQCGIRTTLLARVRAVAPRLNGDGLARPPLRMVRFAFGVSNIPPGQSARVRLNLTPRGKRIAQTSKKRRLRGVIEIRNTAGALISSAPVKIRLR
jgi:uncharacterized repeat protein (TIGR01451 family)